MHGARARGKGYAAPLPKGQRQRKGTRDVTPREAPAETARCRRAVGSARGALTGQSYFISQGLVTPGGPFPRGARVQRARLTGGDMADALGSWGWWLGSLISGL